MSTNANTDITVGVLGLHNSKEIKAILNAIDELGYGTEWLRRENTAISITDIVKVRSGSTKRGKSRPIVDVARRSDETDATEE